MFSFTRHTKEEAFKKIKYYCSFQERSHNEVKQKLFALGLYKSEVNELISNMIENNYLNEERFAKQFAGGKFRMKQWGRKKIQYELQQKGVNKLNIEIGLKEINEEEYLATLQKLAARKWIELSGRQYLSKQAKIYTYLLQKGYESDLINTAVSKIMKEGNKGSSSKEVER